MPHVTVKNVIDHLLLTEDLDTPIVTDPWYNGPEDDFVVWDELFTDVRHAMLNSEDPPVKFDYVRSEPSPKKR